MTVISPVASTNVVWHNATVNATIHAGATTVLADVDSTMNIDPNAMRIGCQTVSLPISAKLTESDVNDVITAVRRIMT